VFFTLLMALSDQTKATVYFTVAEALQKVFPPPAQTFETHAFFSAEDLAKVQAKMKGSEKIPGGLVTYYVAKEGEKIVGTAYLDTHIVRSLSETVLIAVNPDHSVRAIEVLRFEEPKDYKAPEKWLEQFKGKKLNEDLSTKGSVAGITGATLTTRSTVTSVRKVLAIHGLLLEKAGK
jgi:hypothetical protein